MKNLTLSLLIGVVLVCCSSNKDELSNIESSCNLVNFQYYNDAEQYVGEMSNEYFVLGIDTTFSNNEIENFITTIDVVDQNYNYTIYQSPLYGFKDIPLRLNNSKTCEEITEIFSSLNSNPIVSYTHYAFDADNCINTIGQVMGELCVRGYLGRFKVKVFDENDLTDLNQMILETNTELDEQYGFQSQWFFLKATKESAGDAMAMANYFYESGLFEESQPFFWLLPVE